MARLPVLSGAEAVKVFQKAGWTVDRQLTSPSSLPVASENCSVSQPTVLGQ
jgi:hypothetical protein